MKKVELAFEGFVILMCALGQHASESHFTGVKLSDDNAPNYRAAVPTASPVDENMYYQFETHEWAAHNRYFPIHQKLN